MSSLMPELAENHEIQLFSNAAEARKRHAKCAIAHKQADDKADVVLLDSYEAKNQ
ncbi:MAG: hypothetical protein ACYC2W_07150 [Desulfurivibrionaceae bacterium]